jgi:hypothetical protein
MGPQCGHTGPTATLKMTNSWGDGISYFRNAPALSGCPERRSGTIKHSTTPEAAKELAPGVKIVQGNRSFDVGYPRPLTGTYAG